MRYQKILEFKTKGCKIFCSRCPFSTLKWCSKVLRTVGSSAITSICHCWAFSNLRPQSLCFPRLLPLCSAGLLLASPWCNRLSCQQNAGVPPASAAGTRRGTEDGYVFTVRLSPAILSICYGFLLLAGEHLALEGYKSRKENWRLQGDEISIILDVKVWITVGDP